MSKYWTIEVLPDLTVVHHYDRERYEADKAARKASGAVRREAAKVAAASAGRQWEPCVHRGMQTGETKSCLCSERGKLLPIFMCNMHSVECIESPSSLDQKLRVCKRCENGPWADLLR